MLRVESYRMGAAEPGLDRIVHKRVRGRGCSPTARTGTLGD